MAMATTLRKLSGSAVRRPPLTANSLYYMSSLPHKAVEEKGVTWPKQLNAPLAAVDPEIADIIELEKARQWKEEFLTIRRRMLPCFLDLKLVFE